MLRIVDLRGVRGVDRGLLPRAAVDLERAVEEVRPLCAAVAERGEAALRELSERFDGCVPATFRVPDEIVTAAVANLDPGLRQALEESIRRRRLVAESEAFGVASASLAAGASVETRTLPIRRVGLYVPGGLAPLASSVVMNVVPAQVAGVPSIAVASPPQADHGGWPHPTILAACGLLGVSEVYAVGGAQAIALFAYGVTGLCEPVDLVTGPGNRYVVAAKRLLRGRVAIDAEAGPTEIAILADETADPDFVAADLISQAEHDPLAAAVLVTWSEALAARVGQAVVDQVKLAKHAGRVTVALTGPQSAIILVDGLDQGIDVVDAYGAEHLEIITADPDQVAARISTAGAIFIGPWAPVSLGDYTAGSTHVLPTGGSARHSSGLTVRSFLKSIQLIRYDRDALLAVADLVETFAEAEDLPAHARAVSVRR